MSGDSGTSVITFPFVNTAQVVTLATILPLLCINVLGLRFYTRIYRGVGLGLDDWLMLPGVILYIGMCICILIGASHNVIGSSSLQKTNPPLESYLIPKSDLFAKLLFAFQLFVVIAFGFVKCSIISLYRRIFVIDKRSTFDIVCKVMTAIVISWSITFFVIIHLSCGPKLSNFWGTKTEQSTTCKTFTGTQGLAGTDMVIDVALMLMPQPLIWSLKLSTGKKIVISVLIALGCSCIGADIAQTILFEQIKRASAMGIPLDQNEVISLVMYYTCIDGGLAITAACLVTLRPLFRDVTINRVIYGVKSGFSSTSSSRAKVKNWDGSGATDSSGDTTLQGDAEKGLCSLKVIEVQVTTTKRASESIALATAPRCGNCGK